MGKVKTQTNRTQGFEVLRTAGEEVKKEASLGWEAFWNQMGLDLTGHSDSSDTYQRSPDKPLHVMDPFNPHKQEVFDASKHQAKKSTEVKQIKKAESRAEAAINYHADILKNREHSSKQEMREMNQRLQEIMIELQKLVNSSKVLQMEFAGVSVDQAPQQVGEYHLNFFDWLLLTIRAARQKVEDSGAWLASSKKKNGKKGNGYWDMFKKHGTSFALSNERTASNSVA